MFRIRSLVMICMVVLAALALAACGGDDDDATDDGGDETVSATTPAGGEESPSDGEPTATEGGETPDDGDEPSGGGAEVDVSDVCTLVTKAEAEAAFGESVQEPVVTYTGTAGISGAATADVGTCSYLSPNGVPSANVNYWSAPGEDDAIASMVAAACGGKETIDGLGDLACWYDDSHAEIQLGSGSSFIDIFVTMNGDASDALLDISEAAVGRLP